MARLIALLLVAVVVVSTVGPALAATEGSPVLSVHLPDNRVGVGEDARLDLFLLNGGNITTGGTRDDEVRVTTARNVTVAVGADDAPLEVETARRPVGSVPEGVLGPVSFAITVSEAATPGTYELPVTIEYQYTSEIDTSDPANPEHETVNETLNRSITVVIEAAPDFAVTNVTTDVAVGETGSIRIAIRNAGGAVASAASVTVRSEDPALAFGGGPTGSVFVGEWDPGEDRTVSLSASVAPGADARAYPLSVTVSYRDADGDRRQAAPDTTGVVPRLEQSFALGNVSSTLAVGDEGTLRGTVTNTGPTTARNAVVVFSAENTNVVPVETGYAVGDLEPGESATFEFDAEVTDSADAGPRQLSVVVRYRNAADDVRRSDPLDARVDIGPRRGVFSVEPVTAAVRAGETGVLELRVTNDRDEPVTDVSAKLFTDDPLSSGDDEAFIDRLGPGETAVVRFGVTAGSNALEKVYPVSLDFQYDDADGDTRLSDTYDVPVQVTPRDDRGGLSPVVIGGAVIAVLVVLAGGLWYWRGP